MTDTNEGATVQIAALAGDWFKAVFERFGSTFGLAVAEARLAVTTLILMIAVSLVIVLLVFSVWGLVVAAGVIALIQTGVTLIGALLIFAVVHVIFAASLLMLNSKIGQSLEFRATRRQLSEHEGESNELVST